MSARRSCLSGPGSSEKMLAKARGLVCRLLAEGRLGEGLLAVRVNAIDTAWWRDDVAALADRAGSAVDSLVVPKVERAEEVLEVERTLERHGASMRIQALVETAAGLMRLSEIVTASPRLDSLILGYADLAASLGRAHPEAAPERWLYAQDALLVAARAAGIEAIDGP